MRSLEEKIAFAQNLRDNPTASEKLLYSELLVRGIVVEFQPVMLGYIPDFYFPLHKKIVELDGKYHDGKRDAVRDAAFLKSGIRTLRIKSRKMFSDAEGVIRQIQSFLGRASYPKKKKKRQKLVFQPSKPRTVKVLKGAGKKRKSMG